MMKNQRWKGAASEVAGKQRGCGAPKSSKESALRRRGWSTRSAVQIIPVSEDQEQICGFRGRLGDADSPRAHDHAG